MQSYKHKEKGFTCRSIKEVEKYETLQHSGRQGTSSQVEKQETNNIEQEANVSIYFHFESTLIYIGTILIWKQDELGLVLEYLGSPYS